MDFEYFMNKFDYQFPVRIHFGQGCFEDALREELQKYGKTVMLAYGGGSLKRTGLYDRIVKILQQQGKTVEELRELWDEDFWKSVFAEEQVKEWDNLIQEFNNATGVLKKI